MQNATALNGASIKCLPSSILQLPSPLSSHIFAYAIAAVRRLRHMQAAIAAVALIVAVAVAVVEDPKK